MTKVIDLFSRKRDMELEALDEYLAEVPAEKSAEPVMSFEETVKKNKENAERIKKERLKGNKSVIRSYRLK